MQDTCAQLHIRVNVGILPHAWLLAKLLLCIL